MKDKQPKPRYKRTDSTIGSDGYTAVEKYHATHTGEAGSLGLPPTDERDPFTWLGQRRGRLGEVGRQLLWEEYRKTVPAPTKVEKQTFRDMVSAGYLKEQLPPEQQEIINEYAAFMALETEQREADLQAIVEFAAEHQLHVPELHLGGTALKNSTDPSAPAKESVTI
jgi:hypothetical protein